MKKYDFSLYLDGSVMPDEIVEQLYEAGCDDATFGVSNGEAWAGFSRDARSLEDAIVSAVAVLRKFGFRVTRVELEEEGLVALETAKP